MSLFSMNLRNTQPSRRILWEDFSVTTFKFCLKVLFESSRREAPTKVSVGGGVGVKSQDPQTLTSWEPTMLGGEGVLGRRGTSLVSKTLCRL